VKMKSNYDASIKQKSFKEGAYVLLFSPRKKRGTFSRWQVTWLGPYRITKKFNEANYILQKSPRSKGFVVHGYRLKPYHGNIDCKLWPLNSDKEDSQPRQETAQLLEQPAVGGQSNSQSMDDGHTSRPDTRKQHAGSHAQAVVDKESHAHDVNRSRPNNRLAMTSSRASCPIRESQPMSTSSGLGALANPCSR